MSAGRRPLGQIAADSIGADEQGRLEDLILRGQIAGFDIDEAALAAAAERMDPHFSRGAASLERMQAQSIKATG